MTEGGGRKGGRGRQGGSKVVGQRVVAGMQGRREGQRHLLPQFEPWLVVVCATSSPSDTCRRLPRSACVRARCSA